MSNHFKDHFSQHADAYAAFPPGYPPALFAYLASLVTSHDVAWDCATGNGQAAVGLVAHFAQVIATDASREQIAHAVQHPKIRYAIGPAERTELATGSVDLITVANGLHWFDLDRFYVEARRVAKPGAILATCRTSRLSG